MSSEFTPSEITPLRRADVGINIGDTIGNDSNNINNNNINLGSDRGSGSCSASGSSTNQLNRIDRDLDENKMDNSRRILCKIAIDFIILLCVGLPILFFFLFGEPYKRGFYCDDESLKHPFHDSTIKNWMLYIIGLVLPIAIFIIIEIVHADRNKKNSSIPRLKIFGWEILPWVVQAYKQIGIFGFGAACSQLVTDIAKYTIGRLRPHFFSVCQPIMPDGTNCSSPLNFQRYIEDFDCKGINSSPRMLKEMRLSFPSGHSSFSAYTMIYCAIYLHSRMTWRGSKLMKHFLQFLLIMLAWYTALSRVSDYKHHWSDAMAGSVIGIVCALIVANFVSDLRFKAQEKYTLPITRPDTSAVTPSNGRV